MLRERYLPSLLASIPADTPKPHVVGFDAEVTRTNLQSVLGELQGEHAATFYMAARVHIQPAMLCAWGWILLATPASCSTTSLSPEAMY